MTQVLRQMEDRPSDTPLAVVKGRIASESTTITDCWKAYNYLSKEGETHLAVSHTCHCVDPQILGRSNTIERQVRKTHVDEYLARCMCMFLVHFQDLSLGLHCFLCTAV